MNDSTRRHILRTLGVGASEAAGSRTLDQEEVYKEEGNVCYTLDNEELKDENIAFYFRHKNNENEFRQVRTALEPNSNGEVEACISLDQFDHGTYNELAYIEINNQEKVKEVSYSVS